MVSPLLREVRGALALPNWPVTVQTRYTDGVIWDPEANGPVLEALHAVATPPTLHDTDLDQGRLSAAAAMNGQGTRTVEGAAIFGGHLIKHFGHFLHECLGRLWWLGDPSSLPAAAEEPARELRGRLQEESACVYVFVTRWLEPTADLAPYMEEVLEGLGLPRQRIRLVAEPIRFEQLLIPSQAWGFDFNEQAWDTHLGCESRGLMRSLLGGYRIPVRTSRLRRRLRKGSTSAAAACLCPWVV